MPFFNFSDVTEEKFLCAIWYVYTETKFLIHWQAKFSYIIYKIFFFLVNMFLSLKIEIYYFKTKAFRLYVIPSITADESGDVVHKYR